MAIYRPGRLYRKLADVPKPLFQLSTANTGTMTDDQIRSITIHRGKSGAGGGISPSTVEVALANNIVGKAGEIMTVGLTGAAATAIAAKFSTDPDKPAYIAPRFSGRLGQQTMDDQGKRQFNTLFGASWSAQLPNSPKSYSFASGVSVGDLLTTISKPSYLSNRISVTTAGEFDTTWGVAEGTFGDLVGKFAGDIGILMSDSRAGTLQIRTLEWRRDSALSRMDIAMPLTRSQAISPASWTQPNEGMPPAYQLTYRLTDNSENTTVIGDPLTSPVEERNWTYFKSWTDQWKYIHALRAAGFDDRFRIESIEIDLLYLLSSPKDYHRQQARQIIEMQPGDPLYLSGDWPASLRGIHFAEGIREEINPDQWTVTLDLVRFREVVGEESPAVPPRVWDSALNQWDQETKKWSDV